MNEDTGYFIDTMSEQPVACCVFGLLGPQMKAMKKGTKNHLQHYLIFEKRRSGTMPLRRVFNCFIFRQLAHCGLRDSLGSYLMLSVTFNVPAQASQNVFCEKDMLNNEGNAPTCRKSDIWLRTSLKWATRICWSRETEKSCRNKIHIEFELTLRKLHETNMKIVLAVR